MLKRDPCTRRMIYLLENLESGKRRDSWSTDGTGDEGCLSNESWTSKRISSQDVDTVTSLDISIGNKGLSSDIGSLSVRVGKNCSECFGEEASLGICQAETVADRVARDGRTEA
jgi:hypothetical protein